MKYAYIGEDFYLNSGGGDGDGGARSSGEGQGQGRAVSFRRSSCEEVKYTTVATVMKIKVLDEEEEEDNACGKLVHVVSTSPVVEEEEAVVGATKGGDTTDVPTVSHTAAPVQTGSSVARSMERVGGVAETSPKDRDSGTYPPYLQHVTSPRYSVPVPTALVMPVPLTTSSGLKPYSRNKSQSKRPLAATRGLGNKKTASMSVDGIYDLLTAEEEEAGSGLNTEEKIMSIEMLVSDMCRSLDDMRTPSGLGEREGEGEEEGKGGREREGEGEETGAREKGDGFDEDDMEEEEEEDESGSFYINVHVDL